MRALMRRTLKSLAVFFKIPLRIPFESFCNGCMQISLNGTLHSPFKCFCLKVLVGCPWLMLLRILVAVARAGDLHSRLSCLSHQNKRSAFMLLTFTLPEKSNDRRYRVDHLKYSGFMRICG